MLGKFKGGTDWIWPLISHSSVHSLFTSAIVLFFNPKLWWLSWVDFVAHFIMDRIKASPNLLGRYKALSANEYPSSDKEDRQGNRRFWLSLGVDQMFHHLTHYYIIYKILN